MHAGPCIGDFGVPIVIPLPTRWHPASLSYRTNSPLNSSRSSPTKMGGLAYGAGGAGVALAIIGLCMFPNALKPTGRC